VTTKSLSPEQMEKRVARFNKLQTYQQQNFATHGIPAGAVEKITARKVYPVMAPADYQGRSAGAPVKGPRGLIVTAISTRSRTSCASPAASRSPGATTASIPPCSSRST
jgi:hypothetical protein